MNRQMDRDWEHGIIRYPISDTRTRLLRLSSRALKNTLLAMQPWKGSIPEHAGPKYRPGLETVASCSGAIFQTTQKPRGLSLKNEF
jgi:hypothetical protein